MSFTFETAVISVTIGAVLSVLLQSSLLGSVDERLLPPQVVLFLRAADIWLAVVFGLVVVILLDVSLQAIAHHAPLRRRDRDASLHLLLLAGAYPAFTALAKRTLPILYAAPDADHPAPRFQIAFLVLPLVSLFVAASLMPTLIDPSHGMSTGLAIVAATGLLVLGPCLLPLLLEPWWRRRFLRRIRARARERRLVEQSVAAVVPHADGEELPVRVFSDGSRYWIDRREAARVVARASDAVYRARREGVDTTETDRWWVHAWPSRRLSVRQGEARRLPRREWRCHDGFFEATALLQSLGARMPLSAP